MSKKETSRYPPLTPDNYASKKSMIKSLIKEIKEKKQKHYEKYSWAKKINTISKTIINVLNAISVSSLVLSLREVSHMTNILALVTTSISSVGSVSVTSYDLDGKVHSHNTSYLQYTDIYRDISARLRRNGLSSEDLDNMLTELNARLGLIEDQSLPISLVPVSLVVGNQSPLL
jgi:DUF438 domain-containing protein